MSDDPPPTDPVTSSPESDDVAKLRRENASRRQRERELERRVESLTARVLRHENQSVEAIASELGFRNRGRRFLVQQVRAVGRPGTARPRILDAWPGRAGDSTHEQHLSALTGKAQGDLTFFVQLGGG